MASTCSHKNAWVIGDIPLSYPNIKSIEVYDEKIWKIMNFALPMLQSHIGFCSIENSLLLVSGTIAYILDTKHTSIIGDIPINGKSLDSFGISPQAVRGAFRAPRIVSRGRGPPNNLYSAPREPIDQFNSISSQYNVGRDTIDSISFTINTKDIKIA